MSQQNQQLDRVGLVEKFAEALKEHRLLAPKWDERTTFTVEEMGEIFGLSRCTAYAMVKSGDVPAIRMGRLLRIPRAAIERKLAAA